MIALLLVLMLVFLLSSCFADPVISALPGHQKKEYYESEGFQDWTGYAKYYYEGVTAETLEKTGLFQEMTQGDISELLVFLNDYEAWVKTVGGEVQANYDFHREMFIPGNFYYIETQYAREDPVESLWCYDIYYFDLDAQILYYFHNNI
jgi:hypothetical protein